MLVSLIVTHAKASYVFSFGHFKTAPELFWVGGLIKFAVRVRHDCFVGELVLEVELY